MKEDYDASFSVMAQFKLRYASITHACCGVTTSYNLIASKVKRAKETRHWQWADARRGSRIKTTDWAKETARLLDYLNEFHAARNEWYPRFVAAETFLSMHFEHARSVAQKWPWPTTQRASQAWPHGSARPQEWFA